MNEMEHPSFDYLANAGKKLPKHGLLPAIEARLKADIKMRKQVILIAAASVATLMINVAVYVHVNNDDSSTQQVAVTNIGSLNQSFNLYQ